MNEEQKCECEICKLSEKLLLEYKDADLELILFAALKVVIAKGKELAEARADLTEEQVVVTIIDRIAEQFGMIREIGFIGPDDISSGKKGLH